MVAGDSIPEMSLPLDSMRSLAPSPTQWEDLATEGSRTCTDSVGQSLSRSVSMTPLEEETRRGAADVAMQEGLEDSESRVVDSVLEAQLARLFKGGHYDESAGFQTLKPTSHGGNKVAKVSSHQPKEPRMRPKEGVGSTAAGSSSGGRELSWVDLKHQRDRVLQLLQNV
jgi:hypothetical protein